ncbi:hypothetical protein JCM10212_005553 [Sporobolomyces blumeae]
MSFLAATRRALRPSTFASTSRALATAAEASPAAPAAAEAVETSPVTGESTQPILEPLPTTQRPTALDAFVHVPLETFHPRASDPSLDSTSATAERLIVPLPAPLFNVPSRPSLLHKIITAHLSSLRAGTASTKNRAEVNYSGRKMRPQKGTGNARLGSRGSPMLRGGGRAFGPRPKGPDGWKRKINRKEAQLGLRVSLSEKWRAGQLSIVDRLGLAQPSTRTLKQMLDQRGWDDALFVTGSAGGDADERARWAFELSSGNLPNVAVCTDVSEMTVWDIVKRRTVVFDLGAVDSVIERIDPMGPWLEEEWEDFDGDELELEADDVVEAEALERLAAEGSRV